ncbi:hypothetical protein DIPPA_12589 [Diplonema papillatum]|nr:hypothetical protein DIPPA_12589 [Diplonema papillatum]|eukprot:gene1436-2211_t
MQDVHLALLSEGVHRFVNAEAEGGLKLAVFGVPPVGSSSYELEYVRYYSADDLCKAGEPAAKHAGSVAARQQGSTQRPEWTECNDVLNRVAAYLNVYDLARFRSACVHVREVVEATETHDLPCRNVVFEAVELMQGLMKPCVALVAICGRTLASRRFVKLRSLPAPTQFLQKIFYTATVHEMLRKFGCAVEERDGGAAALTFCIDNLRPADATAVVLTAAFEGSPLRGFWDWCHPEVAKRAEPTTLLIA